MTFRLTTLFYLTALVASALAAFGVWGLSTVVVVPLTLWGWHCLRQASEQTKLKAFSPFAVSIIVYVVWPRPYHLPYPPGYFSSIESRERLEAFAHYINRLNVDENLPTDKHSWRVLIRGEIPDISEGDYRFDEPWNSRHNQTALAGYEEAYQRRSHPGGKATHYLGVVDSRCAWSPQGLLLRKEIADGSENTLLLIETTASNIAWNEPRDLTFDEALELLTTVPPPESRDWHVHDRGYFWRDCRYRKVAMCDGSIVDLRIPLDRATAAGLLTADGGERIDWDQVDPFGPREFDYPRAVALGVFVTLALLPIHPAVWRRIMPRSLSTEYKM